MKLRVYVLTRVASLVFDAGGLGDEASGLRPPLASPAPMPRRRPSPGISTRLRALDVILGFAEYGLFSVYKLAILSLSGSISNSASFFFLYCSQQYEDMG